MNIKMHSCLTVMIVVASAVAIAGWTSYAQQPDRTSGGYAWTTESWTENSTPYSNARRRIEHEIEVSANPGAVVGRYKLLAELEPKDRMSVFSWAVSAWYACRKAKSDAECTGLQDGVRDALAVPPPPHSFEYDRIRLFYELINNFTSPELRALAVRMLAATKGDGDLTCSVGLTSSTLPVASDLLNKAIQLEPDNPDIVYLLAMDYVDSYLFEGGPVGNAQIALTGLRKYLAMKPADQDGVRDAKMYIDWVNRYLAEKRPADRRMPAPGSVVK